MTVARYDHELGIDYDEELTEQVQKCLERKNYLIGFVSLSHPQLQIPPIPPVIPNDCPYPQTTIECLDENMDPWEPGWVTGDRHSTEINKYDDCLRHSLEGDILYREDGIPICQYINRGIEVELKPDFTNRLMASVKYKLPVICYKTDFVGAGTNVFPKAVFTRVFIEESFWYTYLQNIIEREMIKNANMLAELHRRRIMLQNQ